MDFLGGYVYGCACYFLKASCILIFMLGWRSKISTANVFYLQLLSYKYKNVTLFSLWKFFY